MLEERQETYRIVETVIVSTAVKTISQTPKTSSQGPDGSQVRVQTSRLQETLIVIERVNSLSVEGNFVVASALAASRLQTGALPTAISRSSRSTSRTHASSRIQPTESSATERHSLRSSTKSIATATTRIQSSVSTQRRARPSSSKQGPSSAIEAGSSIEESSPTARNNLQNNVPSTIGTSSSQSNFRNSRSSSIDKNRRSSGIITSIQTAEARSPDPPTTAENTLQNHDC